MCKKVLVIAEGLVDELRLMKSICHDLGLTGSDVDFYSYKTDFHNFARIILPDGKDQPDDTVDLLLELKSREKGEREREILSGKYTDIYIVFDLDPHASKPDFEKARKLVEYFTSSSDMGKLFINYPMMQSYKHLKTLPDMEYAKRTVDISDIPRYKELVSQEGMPELIKTHNYTHVQLMSITWHNYCKRERMLGRTGEISSKNDYDGQEDVDILDIQISELRENDRCYVLNMSSLMYLEYSPKKFFTEISRHRKRFMI